MQYANNVKVNFILATDTFNYTINNHFYYSGNVGIYNLIKSVATKGIKYMI